MIDVSLHTYTQTHTTSRKSNQYKGLIIKDLYVHFEKIKIAPISIKFRNVTQRFKKKKKKLSFFKDTKIDLTSPI